MSYATLLILGFLSTHRTHFGGAERTNSPCGHGRKTLLSALVAILMMSLGWKQRFIERTRRWIAPLSPCPVNARPQRMTVYVGQLVKLFAERGSQEMTDTVRKRPVEVSAALTLSLEDLFDGAQRHAGTH